MTDTLEASVSSCPDAEWEKRSHSVLGRAALLLGAFDSSHPVLTLATLSEIAGLPKSTVHRFAEHLVDLEWLERSSEGYRVGIRLFEMGSLAYRPNRIRDAALPHMQQLAVSLRCAVNLAVLDNEEVLYLYTLPLRGFNIPVREGGRMPAYCTALGKALLAFAPTKDVETAILRGMPSRTPSTIVTAEQFRKELDVVQAQGVAFDREEACSGVSCVAAPIRGSGRAIGSISAATRSGAIDLRQAVQSVRKAASAIWYDCFHMPVLTQATSG